MAAVSLTRGAIAAVSLTRGAIAAVSLTRGAIAAVSENNYDGMKPVLQVMEVKLVTAASSSAERFRMLLSDGVYLQQAMLVSQMNAIVKSGELRKGSIVQLHEFARIVIQGRRLIAIIHLEVLVSESPDIGAPQGYYSVSATSQGQAPMPAQSPGMDQSAVAARNPQPYAGSHSSGIVLGQNTMGEASLNPKTDTISNNPSYGGSYTRNMNNMNSLLPIAEQGAAVSVTRGVIKAVSESNIHNGMKSVFQVIEIKPLTAARSSAERFQMLLSDGVYHQHVALLGAHMNGIVKSGELRKGSIIQLHQFLGNIIQGLRIIVIMHLEVLASERTNIGAPNSISASSEGLAPVPAQSPCMDDLLSDLVDGVKSLKFEMNNIPI